MPGRGWMAGVTTVCGFWLCVSVVLLSPLQNSQEVAHVHPILECLASIDKNNGNLVGKFPPQFGVGVDVYLTPVKVSLVLNLHERVLNNIAEMAVLPGIHHNIVHVAIVIVPVCPGRVPSQQLRPCCAYSAASEPQLFAVGRAGGTVRAGAGRRSGFPGLGIMCGGVCTAIH